MKFSCQYLIALLFSISSFVIASPAPYSVVYDTDGLGRDTHYDHGPVTSITTSSYSARKFSLFIFRQDFTSSCSYANVFDIDTGARIADGPITAADIKTTTMTLNLDFSDADLQKNKVIRLNCEDAEGNMIGVEHKVPGAPTVEWTSSLTPTGTWIPAAGCARAHCNPGFGHFTELNYIATIIVNNNTDEGYCQVSQERGASIGLFHGKHDRTNFYSDYFSTDTIINAYEPPVILQRISCQNSGGTTNVTQVWEITDGTIHQVENSSYIQ